MADTEQGMGDAGQGMSGETQATESSDSGGPEIMDAGASSGGPEIMDSGASSGTATDFEQVKPLNESDDPAHADFLPKEHDVPEGLISDREGEAES